MFTNVWLLQLQLIFFLFLFATHHSYSTNNSIYLLRLIQQCYFTLLHLFQHSLAYLFRFFQYRDIHLLGTALRGFYNELSFYS